jgi:hypothetical protein
MLSLIFAAALSQQTAALTAEIMQNGHAYDDLHALTDMGHRLSGSPGAARAVQWAKTKMESYGFDNVRLQETAVPVWTRGDVARATVTGVAGTEEVRIAALGGSVGTGAGSIEANVVEVHSLAEVTQLGTAVRGKIVFYNRAMDPTIDPFDAYSGAIDQRGSGPSTAARYGAAAVLVRTLTTLADDDHPHTGMTSYGTGAKIPAAAVSTHGANVLSARLKADPNLKVKIELSCERHPDGKSYNVIGEVTGTDKPLDVVVVGGHLDSWDLATGAHDDGTGVVQAIETVRAIKALGLKPKRTIRAVLFMAEEEGSWGAAVYADEAKAGREHHIAAIESDRGGFAPVGFGTTGGPAALAKLQRFAPLLSDLHADQFTEGESGADVEPLAASGAVAIGYIPEATHYFDYHHSEIDVFGNVVESELHGGAAAIATLAWSIAEEGI